MNENTNRDAAVIAELFPVGSRFTLMARDYLAGGAHVEVVAVDPDDANMPLKVIEAGSDGEGGAVWVHQFSIPDAPDEPELTADQQILAAIERKGDERVRLAVEQAEAAYKATLDAVKLTAQQAEDRAQQAERDAIAPSDERITAWSRLQNHPAVRAQNNGERSLVSMVAAALDRVAEDAEPNPREIQVGDLVEYKSEGDPGRSRLGWRSHMAGWRGKVTQVSPGRVEADGIPGVCFAENLKLVPAEVSPEPPLFPRRDGDVLVLGPGVIAEPDRSVINWEGENYSRQVPESEQAVMAAPGPQLPTYPPTVAIRLDVQADNVTLRSILQTLREQGVTPKIVGEYDVTAAVVDR